MVYIVTGGSGYLGQDFVSHLVSSGKSVINIDIRDPGNGTFIKCDLTDLVTLRDAVKSLDNREEYRIVHLAALFEKDMAKRGEHTAEDFHRMNVLSTRNLFSTMEGSGLDIKSVVFSSAALVNCLGKIDDPYASSKLGAEKIIREWNADSVRIMRISRVVGGSDMGMIPKDIISDFIRKLLSERQVVVNGSNIKRDYVYLSDVRRALLTEESGLHVKNIYSASQISIGEIMETVNHAMFDSGLISKPRQITLKPDLNSALACLEGKSDSADMFEYKTSLQATQRAIKDYIRGIRANAGFA